MWVVIVKILYNVMFVHSNEQNWIINIMDKYKVVPAINHYCHRTVYFLLPADIQQTRREELRILCLLI